MIELRNRQLTMCSPLPPSWLRQAAVVAVEDEVGIVGRDPDSVVIAVGPSRRCC